MFRLMAGNSFLVQDRDPRVLPAACSRWNGHFGFSSTPKETFITATCGGGHTTDATHTDATVPRSWE